MTDHPTSPRDALQKVRNVLWIEHCQRTDCDLHTEECFKDRVAAVRIIDAALAGEQADRAGERAATSPVECPSCGRADPEIIVSNVTGRNGVQHALKCRSCDMQTDWRGSEQAALEEWASARSDRAGGDGQWQIAPCEPTIDMCHAAADFHADGCWDASDQSLFGGIYKAMLAAAPPSDNAGERAGDIDALAEIWRICDRAGEYSKQNLVGAIARIVEARTKARATAPPQPAPDAMREALENIAEFCSDDANKLGAITRLAEIQRIAHAALGETG